MSFKIAFLWNLFLIRGFDGDSSDDDYCSSTDEDVPATRASSQHEALQMLIAHTFSTAVFKDNTGKFVDLNMWTGVECDDNGFVHSIMWHGLLRTKVSEAAIHLEWLPPSIWAFDASNNGLKGSLDFTTLPRNLWRLSLSENKLNGEVELHQLPEKLGFLHLEHNKFGGSVNLTMFPETLEKIALDHNEFTGSIDITLLPRKMAWVYLDNNLFSGPIHIYMLPPALRVLALNNNQLTGPLVVPSLPPYIEFLSLAYNRFDKDVALMCQTRAFDFLEGIDLRGNDFQVIITPHGVELQTDLVWY